MKSKNFITVTSLDKHPKFEIYNHDYNDKKEPIDIPKDTIRICYYPYKDQHGYSFIVNKRLARMLAKRINSHLDYLKGCK